MSNHYALRQCPTGSCGYGAFKGDGDCDGGDSSCANARLFVPEGTDDSFTPRLKVASEAINQMLDEVAAEPIDEGYQLSFLRTPLGIAVGWIRHGDNAEQEPAVEGQVRADDPRVIEELMIDLDFHQGDQSAAAKWTFETSNGQVRYSQGDAANCWIASFLVADTASRYHPAAVRKAVVYMQGLLHGLSNEAKGRKLVLLRKEGGMMLAWAKWQARPTQQGQQISATGTV